MIPIHDSEQGRFSLRAEQEEAFITYVDEGHNVVITHTFVPPSWRGRGVGEILLRALCAWAREERRGVTSQCDYASALLRRHPELAGTSDQAPANE